VLVADIETIVSGWASRVSLPFAPVTDTGKAAGAEVFAAVSPEAESLPHAESASSVARRSATGVSRRVFRDVVRVRESDRGKRGPPVEAASVAHELPTLVRDPYREGR
jgi:hypothetical protein